MPSRSFPRKRRILIHKIQNEKGEIITSRKGIANVFGRILQKNYMTTTNMTTTNMMKLSWNAKTMRLKTAFTIKATIRER